MKQLLVPALLTLSLVLAACSGTVTPLPSDPQSAPVSTESVSPANDSAIRIDEQGAIIIEITPLNLASPTDTFEFNVVMTTHSIDLSMDLAAQSTLTTDTGVSVESTLWDAPLGGHHVEGKLIFPATKDGKPILEGATKLTLTILNVDVPTRIFEWELK
jgi:predicted small secreted protein